MDTFSAKCVQNTVTSTTIKPHPIMLTNGTYNATAAATVNEMLPNWAEQLALYNISIKIRQTASSGRANGKDSHYSDDLLVTFADNGTLMLNAIKANFPVEFASELPAQLGLKLTDEAEAKIEVDEHMESCVPGVFVDGDANS